MMIAMHKNQPSLHIRNPKKNNLHLKSKTFEKKIYKGVDGVRNFTVKSTTNPYKRFRNKQTRFAVHDLSKSYVNTTSHKYVAKTKSQKKRGAPYPRNAIGHSFFLVCIGVYGAIDKQLFTFLEGNRKQTQFHISQVQFLHYNCKKFQKLTEKHDFREHPKTRLIAT